MRDLDDNLTSEMIAALRFIACPTEERFLPFQVVTALLRRSLVDSKELPDTVQEERRFKPAAKALVLTARGKATLEKLDVSTQALVAHDHPSPGKA